MPITIGCRADDNDKHTLDVNHLIFHNGKLYSGGDDGKIKVWSSDLTKLGEIPAHPCSVFCLAAQGDTIYSCSNDGTVKSWDLQTLKHKKTLIEDKETEFWRVFCVGEVLYVGDNQGNIRVFKKEKYYGILSIAEPVKDMILDDHVMFTGNLDIVITDVKLGGEKIQYGNRKSIPGRGPLCLAGNKVCFTSREGKDIIVHEKNETEHFKEVCQEKDTHELIINALAGTQWDGIEQLFSAGWDKVVKKWRIEKSELVFDGSCNVEIVVNALAIGEKSEVYVGGADGHIVRLEIV